MQNFENIFLGKNKVSTSRRSSAAVENGHINPRTSNLINLDETKRTNQQATESFPSHHQYGKTLNVPDLTSVLHVLPIATPPATLNPPRPAIMTTPKSSIVSVKNPSTSMGSLSTENRPLLLVTTDNNQHQPQTSTVPNGRRLPLNGRMATAISTTQRQQPKLPTNDNHQMINEATAQKMPPRKYINNRPRTALFFTSTRTKERRYTFL